MSDPREQSHARLERALELFLDHVDAGGADEALLAEHADLRELLEPMLAPAAPATAALDDDATLGDFRIVRELGRGGMGVVYEAWQRSLDRRVALKVLAPALVAEPASVARFRREAAAVARLRHPGIVEVFGFGCDDGRHWFAMELIDGEPLHRCADQHRSPRAAIDLVAQVADALQHAHAAGLVHRDVKPANVIVRDDGSAVLTDFGLASDAALPSVTTDGSFLGTLDYASPEQAQGEKVDARSDVWSLGVLLYELLTATRPFSRATAAATLKSILTDEVADVRTRAREAGADLAAVVAHALQKSPTQRYQGAAALLADLRALQNGAPVSARHPTTGERVVRWARREPWRAATAAVLLVLTPLAAGAIGYAWANAPKIAAADATAAAQLREEALAAAFLAIHEDDVVTAQRELDTIPTTAGDREVAVVRCYCLDRAGREAEANALLDTVPDLSPAVRAWALGKQIPQTEAAIDADPLELFVQGIEAVARARRDDDRNLARHAANGLARASLQYGTPRAMVLILWMQAAAAADDLATVTAIEAALAHHFPDSKSVQRARANRLAETEPKRALPLLEEAATEKDVQAADLFNLGLAHEELDHVDAAIAAYRRCVALNPQHARAHNNLGLLLRKKKDQRGAVAAFRDAVAADPRHHKAWNNLGITLRSLGEIEPARAALQKAIELRPDYAIAHYNLGNLLRAEDKSAEAVVEFRLAVATDPSYTAARAHLGNALREAGKKQQALIAYALAAETAPRDLIPHYNVGRTALELGLLDLARDAAERGCAVAPRSPDALGLLAEVLQALTRPTPPRWPPFANGCRPWPPTPTPSSPPRPRNSSTPCPREVICMEQCNNRAAASRPPLWLHPVQHAQAAVTLATVCMPRRP
ncbi:MAG: protein kinase [Planctomycetes bacterium]|nr:protein kinase [Planctomycetota bacterium]